ncbi:MAG: hypothetical protein IBX71_03845 [Candidatus Desulforudis sp.]|nr:hypothetical protein [Desulforudis sp.]
MRCRQCGAESSEPVRPWPQAVLTAVSGSLGFAGLGFIYPPLWLGVFLGVLAAPLLAWGRTIFRCRHCGVRSER